MTEILSHSHKPVQKLWPFKVLLEITALYVVVAFHCEKLRRVLSKMGGREQNEAKRGTNIVSENRLLITKRRRKTSCPSERRLEETEKKKGKWKRNGGEEREGTERGRYQQRGGAGLSVPRQGCRCPGRAVGSDRACAAPGGARLPRRRPRARGADLMRVSCICQRKNMLCEGKPAYKSVQIESCPVQFLKENISCFFPANGGAFGKKTPLFSCLCCPKGFPSLLIPKISLKRFQNRVQSKSETTSTSRMLFCAAGDSLAPVIYGFCLHKELFPCGTIATVSAEVGCSLRHFTRDHDAWTS
ncbi:uncharacterized protein [Aphelocoma coerulescens]|uniref:uncharacterized protein n=1 Tax=Aphelocoma coerulescens TaxID=39617 RepID=UPI0036045CC1